MNNKYGLNVDEVGMTHNLLRNYSKRGRRGELQSHIAIKF